MSSLNIMESLYGKILFEKKNVDVGLEDKIDILFYKKNKEGINSTRYYILNLRLNKLLLEVYFDRIGHLTGGREKNGYLANSIGSISIERFFEKYSKIITNITRIMPKNICGLMGSLFLDSEDKLKRTMDDDSKELDRDSGKLIKTIKYLPSC